ncbi:unnamed protein product [Enterobius vermicularis]|uniref:E3 SUMO-protein ligase KIAA1586-like n=1 Tax=Enterobius vermicularis TaxID=51028 RepID=A0A158QBD1_ENTVE|nr:unnamed protein product [Enterobius vermicularis]
MLFLPRVVKSEAANDIATLETELFRKVRDDLELTGMQKLRYRLSQESVDDEILVTKHEFMHDKCLSLTDGQTELRHTLWQWLYRATEMVMDVGHKLCPSPVILEKKCSKTKRQMAAAEEYQTMLSLFNSRTITFSSSKDVAKVFKIVLEEDMKKSTLTKAMMIRFCDENAGHLSFAFTNSEDSSKPFMGSLSADQIKDFKQGLPEFLFDESFPKQYDKIIRTEIDRTVSDSSELNVTAVRKKSIFNNYNTLRLQNDCIQIKDSDSIRINPLTGERVSALDYDLSPGLPQISEMPPQERVNFDCSEAPKSNDTVTENILDNLCSPSLENQQRKDEKADTPPPYVLSN